MEVEFGKKVTDFVTLHVNKKNLRTDEEVKIFAFTCYKRKLCGVGGERKMQAHSNTDCRLAYLL